MTKWLAFLFVAATPPALLCHAWRDRPLDQDAPQYFALAESLAAGDGYVNRLSPWPNQPTCERMPGWPALVAGILWLLPADWEGPAVIRWSGVGCLTLAGAGVALLCRRLGVGSWAVGAGAGLGVAWSPPLVFVALSGMSEVAFLLCVVAGLVLLTFRDWRSCLAGLVLGGGVMIRTNFVLAGPLALAAWIAIPPIRRRIEGHLGRVRGLVVLALFTAPIVGWAIRNERITGAFPVLAAIEGETFLGSNNAVVAGNRDYWGSWIMPDEIPGIPPKFELARTRSDVELSRYYHEQGAAWIQQHPRDFAVLLLGKLVRGFLPIPWNPQPATYVAFAYRGGIVLAAIFLARRWWPRVAIEYLAFLAEMLAIVGTTTLVYYGNYRFTHCLFEVFLIPLIALALDPPSARTNK